MPRHCCRRRPEHRPRPARELAAELLVQPFTTTINAGRYWLTRLMSRTENEAMARFRAWLIDEIAADEGAKTVPDTAA